MLIATQNSNISRTGYQPVRNQNSVANQPSSPPGDSVTLSDSNTSISLLRPVVQPALLTTGGAAIGAMFAGMTTPGGEVLGGVIGAGVGLVAGLLINEATGAYKESAFTPPASSNSYSSSNYASSGSSDSDDSGFSVGSNATVSTEIGGTTFRSDGVIGFNAGGTSIYSDGSVGFDIWAAG